MTLVCYLLTYNCVGLLVNETSYYGRRPIMFDRLIVDLCHSM